jgi:hypothetical protein
MITHFATALRHSLTATGVTPAELAHNLQGAGLWYTREHVKDWLAGGLPAQWDRLLPVLEEVLGTPAETFVVPERGDE